MSWTSILCLWFAVAASLGLSRLYRSRDDAGFLSYRRRALLGTQKEFKLHVESNIVVTTGDKPFVHDHRSVARILIDRISAIISDLSAASRQVPYRLGVMKTTTEIPISDPSVLVVLVHGLRGHPTSFLRYIPALKARQPDARVVLPYVPEKGLCTLDEAAAPVLELVSDHLDRYGADVPVWLVGTSNGARIAAHVESQLRKRASTIHTVAIGGPFGGSEAVWLVDRLPEAAARVYFPRELQDELRPQSSRALALLDAMNAPLCSEAKRRYTFMVTLDEHNIWPPTFALPRVSVPAEYAYSTGDGHTGIAEACLPFVLDEFEKPWPC